MLSGDDKTTIREQELFRKEIREELSPIRSRSVGGRAWDILNSNFGMWFLSAVLLSGLGTLYTRHQTRIDDARKKAEVTRADDVRVGELRDRLKLEISFRLSTALSRLNRIDKMQGKILEADQKKNIQRALAPLVLPASDTEPPLFPEFKAFSGIALIAELRRHVPDGEKIILKKILGGASMLFSETYSEHFSQTRTASEVGSMLLNRMRYPEWENNFPFTDCPDQKPFC